MKLEFHPEARVEYLEAAAFYERKRLGLGAAFTREIEAVIGCILEAPDRWRFIKQDVRRCLGNIFPYSVLYTVERDFVLIVAVAHQPETRLLARATTARLNPDRKWIRAQPAAHPISRRSSSKAMLPAPCQGATMMGRVFRGCYLRLISCTLPG